jgi:putative endonuclease
MRERRYYVYILSSKSRVLYVGMTGFLMSRVLRHQAGEGGAFTRKYRVHRLVYFESFQNVENAISRDGDQEVASREKSGIDSARESYMGGPCGGLGRVGSHEDWRSRFLTGRAGRFGMIRVLVCGELGKEEKQVPHRSCRPVRNDKSSGVW